MPSIETIVIVEYIKCEAEYPQCDYCMHHSIVCTYNRIASGSRKRKEHYEHVYDEGFWNKRRSIQPKLSFTKTSMFSLGFMYPNGMRHTAHEGLAWIELRTGETVNAKVPPTRPSLKMPNLPASPIVERYVTLHCSSYQSLVFPVIGKSLYTETLDLAYGPPGHGAESAKSCIYAFLSVATTYAMAAESSTVSIINEMTIDGLQALIMLVWCYFRLNKSIPDCHLRDLFWLCYSFDQDICLRIGQPPCIPGVFCNLELSPDYALLQDTNLQQEQTLSITNDTLPLYPWDLRLSQLKADIYVTLYSTTACQKSNSETYGDIRTLDQALEQWRTSLHPTIRPTLQFLPWMPVGESLNTQAVMLRLAYYHCVMVIHQASERRHEGPGLCSSINLVVSASRSTLSFLQIASPVVEGECFCINVTSSGVVIFYAITAILTLFRNILKNPLDSATTDFLEVLENAPNLTHENPTRTLTVGLMVHL
ncbi:hypothetical protein BDV25DRAFT_128024 [Aspergillus avenaceus]|uniref:Transcription factor domain-containing protein n=1 Tax=Aspergillus avenaceus TaxID=36643 RepID=A0A5N6U169_ASPAV|nr:hypothetical protein BDV25DRAFT_128024 [Aspergillus avenaceus]